MATNQTFIKLEEYKEILDIVDLCKAKLSDVNSTLNQIDSIRSEEAKELSAWRDNVKEIESKISSIDKNLFNPEE
ncbi:MAG: hypothetical protein PHU51_01120 [Candidatus Nanoarchaeia archaeon]|nr:hypothetical protein [Candidatus Nanoarchaeia archaeon]